MSGASQVPELPRELFSLIVDELCDDWDGLKAAGLANTQFYLPTRRYLFEKVYIGKVEPESRASILVDILEATPVLQTYVRKLELENDATEEHDGWMIRAPSAVASVVKLLSLLPSVTELFLSGDGDGVSWPDVPVELRQGLLGLLAQPGIRTVYLDFINDLDASIIAGIPQIRDLWVRSLEYRHPHGQHQFSPSAPPGPGPGPQLKLLRIGMSGDFWRDLLWHARNTPNASYLLYPRILSLDLAGWDEAMVGAWSDLLEFGAAYVEVLRLSFNAVDPLENRTGSLYPSAVLNFTRFSRLDILVLRCYTPYLYVAECNPFPDFLDALESWAQHNSIRPLQLQSIVIQYLLLPAEHGSPLTFSVSKFMEDFSLDGCWSRFRNIIRQDAFRGLRSKGKIVICFEFEDENLDQWRLAKVNIGKALEEIRYSVEFTRDEDVW